jgi:serine/threonine protein kinase
MVMEFVEHDLRALLDKELKRSPLSAAQVRGRGRGPPGAGRPLAPLASRGRPSAACASRWGAHTTPGRPTAASTLPRHAPPPCSLPAPRQVKCLMRQLLAGIAYLHEHWVLHRDLKTSNLLYGNDGTLKICDFGLARQYGSPLRPYTPMGRLREGAAPCWTTSRWSRRTALYTLPPTHPPPPHTHTLARPRAHRPPPTQVVTLWYRSIEKLLGQENYSTPLDMWAVGCIMAELLSGTPLFKARGPGAPPLRGRRWRAGARAVAPLLRPGTSQSTPCPRPLRRLGLAHPQTHPPTHLPQPPTPTTHPFISIQTPRVRARWTRSSRSLR